MPSRNIVLDKDHLDHVVRYFKRFGAFVYDVETVPPHRDIPAHNTVTWISLATYGMCVVVPMGHEKGDRIIGTRKEPYTTSTGKIQHRTVQIWEPAPEQLRPSQVFDALEPLMFSDRVKVCHNAPFDLGSVAKYYDGQPPDKPYFDTLINGKLLDENRPNGLKERVEEVYKITYDTEDIGKRVETHPFSTVARYAYMDAKYTWLLYLREKDLCDRYGLRDVLNLELDVIDTVLEMTLTGAPINPKVLSEFGKILDDRLVNIEADIYRQIGRQINLNSAKQKAVLLYSTKREGGLGLKPTTPTKSGLVKIKKGQDLDVTDWSTDSDSLKAHKDHPVVSRILDYQHAVKLKSTYVTGVLGDPDNPTKPCRIIEGRVHGGFNQLGARTGRWSSSGPNLQNIPSRSDDGKIIRSAYQAAPGWKLIVPDYGQIELVLLAHFIGKGMLYEGFHKGIDAHTTTASLVFGVPFDAVTKAMRSVAKGLNFAIVYGAGPATVAEMADISVSEAKVHMSAHREMFPEIYRYRNYVIEKARNEKHPHVRTILGRMRRLPELRSRNDELRAEAERKAFNSKIQGSGADLIKLAMVRYLRNKPKGVELNMTVHDELVSHSPQEQVDAAVAAIKEAMLGREMQQLVRVPLTADVQVVDKWSEAK